MLVSLWLRRSTPGRAIPAYGSESMVVPLPPFTKRCERYSTTAKVTGINRMPITVASVMPPTTTVPRMRRDTAPEPLAVHSGRATEDERQRRHHDGAEAQPRCVQRRIRRCSGRSRNSTFANSTIRIAFFAESPISMTRPMVREDVVFKGAQCQRQIRAQNRDRRAQQNAERQRPAFIERRQNQKDEEQRESRRPTHAGTPCAACCSWKHMP